MPIPFRALVLTAAATGVFALALQATRPRPTPHYTPRPALPEVDADALTPRQQDALLDELSDQL